MIVVIREGDERPPVLVTGKATSVCFYDTDGNLVRAVAVIPGGDRMMTTTRGDEDFSVNVDELKIPSKLIP